MSLFGVDLQVVGVQVRLVFVCRFVSSVAVFDHWVQQVFEHLVGLLISGHAAHRHDERVTCGDTKWLTVPGSSRITPVFAVSGVSWLCDLVRASCVRMFVQTLLDELSGFDESDLRISRSDRK